LGYDETTLRTGKTLDLGKGYFFTQQGTVTETKVERNWKHARALAVCA